jgi:diguanylate cyclase (GGDEF)-like protein
VETILLLALVASLAGAGLLAVSLGRRVRRLRTAEDAVVTLTRSWTEDGTSRGRLCAAARLVAGAQAAFLVEPDRRDSRLVVTVTADASELAGVEFPNDPARSLLARVYAEGQPLHVAREDEPADDLRTLAERLRMRSLHVRPAFRGGRTVALLVVGWRSERRDAVDRTRGELLGALADEAARAVERDAHVALLNRQARTDELTALPNRRAWEEALQRELARAQRTGDPLCVALLDLDHFKVFNDRHGHQAGDAHLRRTAAAWRRELRTIDVLARYGGEEFGVLLPDCDPSQAGEVIDRVRRATPGGESASAGVVAYDRRETAESLLARADAALYRAKHAGRALTVHG